MKQSNIVPDPLYLPNRFARYFLKATSEIIGHHGLDAILSLAQIDAYHDDLPPDTLDRDFSFAHMAQLNQALEDMYGVRGGRGMAQRIGRAWLGHGLTSFGALGGIDDPAFRALDRTHRAHLSLLALADVFTRFSDQHCRIEERPETFHFVVQPCAIAHGRRSDHPVCAAMLGLLQETLRWSSNGYDFPLQESACQASGDPACIFIAGKTPFA